MLEIQNMHNMHKYAKCIFFSKLLKTLFLGGSYDSEQLWDFSFLPWKKVLENNKIFTPAPLIWETYWLKYYMIIDLITNLKLVKTKWYFYYLCRIQLKHQQGIKIKVMIQHTMICEICIYLKSAKKHYSRHFRWFWTTLKIFCM